MKLHVPKGCIKIITRRTDNTMTNRKGKKTNNDLQNTTQKTKDRERRTLIKPGMESGIPEGYAVPAPHVAPVVLRHELVNKIIVITSNGPYRGARCNVLNRCQVKTTHI